MLTFGEHLEREIRRYEDGLRRLPEQPSAARDRQLTRVGNAAYGAGLALVLGGAEGDARAWFARAAERYRELTKRTPGTAVALLKAELLAGGSAVADAKQILAAGAADDPSAIARYAACLALLALERDAEALALAAGLDADDGFPADVAASLAALAGRDATAYAHAVSSVLASFERREDHLEGVPVADTVLVLQRLAAARGIAAPLSSPLLG